MIVPSRFMSLLLLWTALLASQPVRANTVWRAQSPDGAVAVEVSLDPQARVQYSASWRGRPVIAPSKLGFLFTNRPKLDRNLMIEGAVTQQRDRRWTLPWGERRAMRDRHTELAVTVRERAPAGRRFTILFRLFEDGLGFRYEVPAEGDAPLGIQEELTEFNFAEAATAWWVPALEWKREEYLYNRTPLAEVALAQSPLTLRTASGTHVSIHEAALINFAAMNLAHVGGHRLRARLTPAGAGPPVTRSGPWQTPWRTVQLSDTAAGLVDSQLILNLNEPSRLGNADWVRPCKYIGIWWSLHLEQESWAAGPRHGATTANVTRYIDFAADHGLCGVLFEGWNTGWDSDWFGNGESFSFTQAAPGLDLAAVAARARTRRVRLIGHHETSGYIAHYERQLAPALDLYRSLGIDAVKTGYVADAGGIKADGPAGLSYEWHEGQMMARHHQRVVEEAARRRIAINVHEPIKDTGLRRTWPNLMTSEGARGMEYNAWGNPINPPEHEATLVFTRLLAGPMDFTPGIVSLEGRDGRRIPSTLAKQLGLYVLIQSPLQMLADLPENYLRHPQAFAFLKQVPIDWEDTRGLAGEIGEFAVIARRERGGEGWWLGGVTDGSARTVRLPLANLASGAKRWRLTIWRDADDADWRDRPHAMAIETREVGAGDMLTVRMAAGGGFAAELRPLVTNAD
jgi:alpha-glucosidase